MFLDEAYPILVTIQPEDPRQGPPLQKMCLFTHRFEIRPGVVTRAVDVPKVNQWVKDYRIGQWWPDYEPELPGPQYEIGEHMFSHTTFVIRNTIKLQLEGIRDLSWIESLHLLGLTDKDGVKYERFSP